MDIILLLKAAILGIVEGLTEFLPISSTGHLLIAGSLLNFTGERAKVFEIVIQCGAIVAVLIEYRQRFASVCKGLFSDRQAQRFVLNIAIAFLPLAIVGLLLSKWLKAYLFNSLTVAVAFIVGGLIILWVERREHVPRVREVDELTPLDALKLGLAQMAALIPGTSRSGATIIGGMLFGLSRKAAAEFSFFLAVPTLFAASGYSLWKERALFSAADIPLFTVGTVFAFLSAVVAVKGLIRFVSTHNFKVFAWYRIAFGLLVLLTAAMGWVDWNPD